MISARSWSPLRALAACLLLSAGCVRGCACGGGPPITCKSNSDCPAGTECVRDYCREAAFAQAERRCRSGGDCKEKGLCGAEYKVSFLGQSRETECVAVADEDCKASDVCNKQGHCSLNGLACMAATDDDCRRSPRCATHDECSFSEGACIRKWEPCTTNDALTRAPALRSGSPSNLISTIDVASLPPFVPGAGITFKGTIACQASSPRDFDRLEVRAGDLCAATLEIGTDSRTATFVLPGVTLSPGQSVGAGFSDREFIGAHAPAFAKAKYDGISPVQGNIDGVELSCRLVPPEAALKIAAPSLATADQRLAEAKQERPDPNAIAHEPRSLADVEQPLAGAGAWLGWNHAELTKRMAEVDAARASWNVALGELFDRMGSKAVPPGKSAEVEEGIVAVATGLVCGKPLADRWAKAHAQQPPPPLECGVEVRLENRLKHDVHLVAGPSGTIPFRTVSFLRRTPTGGVMEVAAGVDLRLDAPGSPTTTSLKLESGKMGSSRVDLQACKLEYSIVSPK